MDAPGLFTARDPESLRRAYGRLDFEMLQDGALHRVASRSQLGSLADRLAALGYAIKKVDAAAWIDEASAYDSVSRAFAFPDGGARTLDALFDWLKDAVEFGFDLDPAVAGTVLTISGFGSFRQNSPALAVAFLHVLNRITWYAAVVNHLMPVLLEDSGEVEMPARPVRDVSYLVE